MYYQARIDSSSQEVNHELNQNIRIEQNLSELRYKVYFDFMSDAYLSLNYRKRCIKMDDE